MMSTKTLTAISDTQLRQNVLTELDWQPSVNTHILVSVDDGIVTLGGTVGSYREKRTAERVIKYLSGVRGVVNDLEVKLPAQGERTDADIARAATQALAWRVDIPSDLIRVSVQDGQIILEGEVNWEYQRTAAEGAVQHVKGVKSVANRITVMHQTTASEIKGRIVLALLLSAQQEAEKISVDFRDGKVTLRGKVRAWPQKEEAERAARAIPGVTEVENDLRFSLK